MSSPLDWTLDPNARPLHWTADGPVAPDCEARRPAWRLRGGSEPMRSRLHPCELPVAVVGSPVGVLENSVPAAVVFEHALSATLDAPSGWAGGGLSAAREAGFTNLFDGTSTADWEMAGSGHFVI